METERINEMIGILQVVGMLVFGLAVLLLIFGGLRYALGSPYESEQAKIQIIYAELGMIISMIALVIIRIFTDAEVAVRKEPSDVQVGPWLVYALVVASSILGSTLYLGKRYGARKEDVLTETVAAEGMTLDDVKTSLKENHVGPDLANRYLSLIEGVETLRGKLEELDMESAYKVQEAFERDIIDLYDAHRGVDDEAMKEQEEKITGALVQMQNDLDAIQESMKQNKRTRLERTLAAINGKYDKG